jgi:type IV secretion system protein TrbL
LFVGAFALIITQFQTLADAIFQSFSKLGLTAGGGTISADALLKPGHLAGVGFQAAWPLLDQVSKLMGFTSFFDNFVEIMVLMVAWLAVVCAFFVLAIQLFITILEFKLATLGGFVLVPFALWNRTGFLAERVLGHVVSSGIKVMMLGVIVGIGTGFFGQFVDALQGREPDIAEAASLALASLSLLGLGIFGPGVASGLVSGGPQLGAGSVVGTAALAGAGLGAMAMGGRAIASGGLAAIRSASAMPLSPAAASGGGSHGPRSTGANAQIPDAPPSGSRSSSGADANDPRAMPDWARSLQRRQAGRQQQQMLIQTLREGESRGGGSNPDLGEDKS